MWTKQSASKVSCKSDLLILIWSLQFGKDMMQSLCCWNRMDRTCSETRSMQAEGHWKYSTRLLVRNVSISRIRRREHLDERRKER